MDPPRERERPLKSTPSHPIFSLISCRAGWFDNPLLLPPRSLRLTIPFPRSEFVRRYDHRPGSRAELEIRIHYAERGWDRGEEESGRKDPLKASVHDHMAQGTTCLAGLDWGLSKRWSESLDH